MSNILNLIPEVYRSKVGELTIRKILTESKLTQKQVILAKDYSPEEYKAAFSVYRQLILDGAMSTVAIAGLKLERTQMSDIVSLSRVGFTDSSLPLVIKSLMGRLYLSSTASTGDTFVANLVFRPRGEETLETNEILDLVPMIEPIDTIDVTEETSLAVKLIKQSGIHSNEDNSSRVLGYMPLPTNNTLADYIRIKNLDLDTCTINHVISPRITSLAYVKRAMVDFLQRDTSNEDPYKYATQRDMEFKNELLKVSERLSAVELTKVRQRFIPYLESQPQYVNTKFWLIAYFRHILASKDPRNALINIVYSISGIGLRSAENIVDGALYSYLKGVQANV